MKKILPLIIFFILSYISFAQTDYIQIADQYINQNISQLHSAGSIVAIIKDNKVIHHRAFGKRNIEKNLDVKESTLFRIGSLTKTFTASAIMILKRRGLLKIDDPIQNYIQEFKNIQYPYPDSPLITIRHLLTHSSGLIRHPEPDNLSINGLINIVLHPKNASTFIQDSNGFQWYPGYKYNYSNIAIALLGEIVSRVSQKSIKDFIKQDILTALEMNNTYWHESELPQDLRSYSYNNVNKTWLKNKDWDLEGYSAAGSLYSNINDLAKWMGLQFKTSPQDNSKILSPFIIKEMHRVQRLQSSNHLNNGTGLIWRTTKVSNNIQTGHNGATGGYRAFFSFDSHYKIGVVVMASNGQADTTYFGENLLATLQKAIRGKKTESFISISNKIFPYLQLKKKTNYQNIFDKRLFNSFETEERWFEIFHLLDSRYGKIKSILEIIPQEKKIAKILFQTERGIVSYKITLSSQEKGKLSGILFLNFKSKSF